MFKKTISQIKKLPRQVLAREFFYFLACLWVVLGLLEIIFPNIVLAYFNLNYLFALLVIFGLITLIKD